MNGMFKMFVSSLIVYLCLASLCFSADTTGVNKESLKSTSELKNNSLKKESLEQKKDVVKQESSEQKQNGAKAPSMFFPAPHFEFDQMVDGTELTHDFIIMNKGTDTLQVQKVKTG